MKELSVSRARLGGLLIAIVAVAIVLGLPARTPSTSAQAATLVIDADTTNGICSTVDASRSVVNGTPFTVALCLLDAGAPPVSGGMNTVTLEVQYGPEITASDVAPDNTTDLNSNPDWNEGPLSGPESWDCNLSNNPLSAPSGTPSPAKVICGTVSLNDQPVTGNLLLATISFTAQGAGTTNLTWGDPSSILSGPSEALCVDAGLTCQTASIEVTGGPPPPATATFTSTPTAINTPLPTNTPTASRTPLPTNTPCVVSGATCTPTAQQRRTVTPTPTVPGDETPGAPGETPGAPGGGGTPPPGGGPGGVGGSPTRVGLTGPDTGDGDNGPGSGGGLMSLVLGGLAVGVAGIAAGGFLRARALRSRS